MIAASADYHVPKTHDAEVLLADMRRLIETAVDAGAAIVVLPAFIGCLYDMLRGGHDTLRALLKDPGGYYLGEMSELTRAYDIHVCPGSYWEREAGHVYHTTCVLHKGKMIAKQRQLYLARWERDLGLSRGTKTSIVTINGWNVGLIVSTDVFYPQVSRALALQGAGAVLCPAAYVGERNDALQIAGMWQEAQQNNFFAVESGYTGALGELSLWGRASLYAPIETTEMEDGYLAYNKEGESLIYAELDNTKRQTAIARFDVLSQLNRELYRDMGLFAGDQS